MATRTALGLPSCNRTNTFRLVNGEGDGLSGLAIDVLNDVVVIMSSAAWCEAYQTEIRAAVVEELTITTATATTENSAFPKLRQVLWKTTASRLKQDGWEMMMTTTTTTTMKPEKVDDADGTEESISNQDASTAVIVQESGVLYRTYPFQDGQKTGVYCDQRDNKYNLAMLCQGKSVLDLCCYHGGFSLTAKLLGGAKHCTGVDSSQDAINVCRENAQLNGIADQDMDFIRDDVDNFMKLAAATDQPRYWDVIVLDPPKLAPSVSGLDRAARKYHSLNRDALKLINPTDGGLFLDVHVFGCHDAEGWWTVFSSNGPTGGPLGRTTHHAVAHQWGCRLSHHKSGKLSRGSLLDCRIVSCGSSEGMMILPEVGDASMVQHET